MGSSLPFSQRMIGSFQDCKKDALGFDCQTD